MSSASPPPVNEPSADDILPVSSSGVKLDEPLLRRFCVAKSFRCDFHKDVDLHHFVFLSDK